MLRILHTGDWHLDSPFSSLDARRAAQRQRELRATFQRMIAYAVSEAVDLVLVAGDVFDREYVTTDTVAFMKEQLGQMSCPVVIAPGNHDCCGAKSLWMRTDFPANVYVFQTEELSCFRFDELGTDVYGYAFTAPEMATSPLIGRRVPDDGRIHLAVIHADMRDQAGPYAPLNAADIEAFGADWTALGHVHNPPPLTIAENKTRGYGYCGCLEGRGPDERGPKGAVLVEIGTADGRRNVRAERIRFSRRRYETDTLSLDGISSAAVAEARIRDLITVRGYGEDTLLTLRLQGRTDPSLLLPAEALQKDGCGLFSLCLKDETEPEPSGRLSDDPTVRGEFYRLLREPAEGEGRDGEIARRAMRYGLTALSGGSVQDE